MTLSVLVLLGAAVRPDGTPGPALLRRTKHAARLARRVRFDAIIVTGGIVRNPPAEATLMRDLLVRSGIDPRRIVSDARSTTTIDNARFVAAWLAGRPARIIVVTDAFHAPRASVAFRAVRLRVHIRSPHRHASAASTIRPALHEAAGLLWYLARHLAPSRLPTRDAGPALPPP